MLGVYNVDCWTLKYFFFLLALFRKCLGFVVKPQKAVLSSILEKKMLKYFAPYLFGVEQNRFVDFFETWFGGLLV